MVADDRLPQHVQDRLAGVVATSGGRVSVRQVRHGRAATSRIEVIAAGVQAWSPEQIANRLAAEFPHDESMRISQEAIYQALNVSPEAR